MSTGPELLARLRRLVNELAEGSSPRWTDVVLYEYLTDEYWDWWRDLSAMEGAGWGVVRKEFTVAADTEESDLSSVLTRRLMRINKLYFKPSPNVRPVPVDKAQVGELETYRSPNSVGLRLIQVHELQWRDGTPYLQILPKKEEAADFILDFIYEPDAIDASTTSIDVPQSHEPLLLYRAAQVALAEEGTQDGAYADRIARLEMNLRAFIHTSGEAHGIETVRDEVGAFIYEE